VFSHTHITIKPYIYTLIYYLFKQSLHVGSEEMVDISMSVGLGLRIASNRQGGRRTVFTCARLSWQWNKSLLNWLHNRLPGHQQPIHLRCLSSKA